MITYYDFIEDGREKHRTKGNGLVLGAFNWDVYGTERSGLTITYVHEDYVSIGSDHGAVILHNYVAVPVS